MVKLTTLQKPNGEIYYYAQRTVRDPRTKKTSSQSLGKIGKHSDLLKITDDPRAYAQKEIERLDALYKEDHGVLPLELNLGSKIISHDDVLAHSKILNTGYFYLQYILGNLGLRKYCRDLMANRKAEYNAFDIHRFLVYAQTLNPGSKLKVKRQLNDYFEQVEFSHQDILRYMDMLDEDYDHYLEYLYDTSSKYVKRDTSVCYYDCTNFFFENEGGEREFIDPVTGEIVKDIREYGCCKEGRPNPIVEMGLFMDRDGIPITMCLHPGSTNEQITAIPAERQVVKMFKGKELIYCADAGLGSYDIRKYNSFNSRSFIITQSIKKLSEPLKSAIFSDIDYRLLSSNEKLSLEFMKSFDRYDEEKLKYYKDRIYKVIPADHSIILNGFYDTKTYKNGSTREVKARAMIKQHLLITFSRKTFEYQRFIRSAQIERAKKLLANATDPEEIKNGPNDVRRFIKLTPEARKKIEGLSVQERYEINNAQILEEERYDGFYAIATNLPVADENGEPVLSEVQKVLSIMSDRYKIEENFRIIKTDFSGRPVYHRLPKRIRAHFMICYTALMVHRLLEKKLDDLGEHFTIQNVIDTLKSISVVPMNEKNLYMSTYEGNKILEALQKLTGLELNDKYYREASLFKDIKKFF